MIPQHRAANNFLGAHPPFFAALTPMANRRPVNCTALAAWVVKCAVSVMAVPFGLAHSNTSSADGAGIPFPATRGCAYRGAPC